ncbi:EH signature domain-containing protein [Rhodobacter sp. KR11]|uniref:EH signature domain-containing protein n=1 Tax=Rhodobacter sp. KR11 TaxID=2974588 RepID=UPI0022227D88|nr:EH signature domain-containing protein [Rhodobacter sp. KR11]MCW1918027.1 EH signature domain-containing protein [Rhodobacter sp. KR11]
MSEDIPLSERLTAPRALNVLPPPSLERMERTVRAILDRFDRPKKGIEQDAEKLFADLARRIREDDWHKVPMNHVVRVADLLFSQRFRDRLDWAPLRTFLLDEVRASTKHGFLNPMLRIYLDSFVPGATHSRALAAALMIARPVLQQGRWGRLIGSLPDLFNSDTAARDLAARMITMAEPWEGLRELGLRQPHGPGLMDAAHLEYLKLLGPRLNERLMIDTLLSWLKPAGQPARAVGSGEAIMALLRPWMQKTPPKDLQAHLIDQIADLYGHPKVNRQAAWNQVDPAIEAVFLRWITGADIRFLFKTLAEVERNHMWADREDFWWTLYEQGRIKEVWIAFNEAGYRAAVAKLPEGGRNGVKRFGRQIGERDKSLLIMDVGGKIIVEGTFNFKVHVFEKSALKTPRLYESRYDVSDIRNLPGSETKMHHGDWQSWVRHRI